MNKYVAIALLLASSTATAMPDNSGRYYVAGDLGSANYSNRTQFSNPSTLRIAAGYYFVPRIAFEAGYTAFGDSHSTSAKISADSLQLAATGAYPLTMEIDLTGKIGLAHNQSKTSNVPSGSHNSLLIGLGTQYRIDPRISMRLQYEDYGRFDNSNSPLKAKTIAAGLTYDF
jgi:OOP family OmpA-OmpF porin